MSARAVTGRDETTPNESQMGFHVRRGTGGDRYICLSYTFNQPLVANPTAEYSRRMTNGMQNKEGWGPEQNKTHRDVSADSPPE